MQRIMGKNLRRRSKSKATLDKADRALQDYYRARYTGARCEVCGKPFETMHHHLLKSQSNAGRFERINLIFICHKCHSKISFGDLTGVARYSSKRGLKWVEKIETLKKVRKQYYTKKELEAIIKKYEL